MLHHRFWHLVFIKLLGSHNLGKLHVVQLRWVFLWREYRRLPTMLISHTKNQKVLKRTLTRSRITTDNHDSPQLKAHKMVESLNADCQTGLQSFLVNHVESLIDVLQRDCTLYGAILSRLYALTDTILAVFHYHVVGILAVVGPLHLLASRLTKIGCNVLP